MNVTELINQLSQIPNPDEVEVIIEANGFCPLAAVEWDNLRYEPVSGMNRGDVRYYELTEELRSVGYTESNLTDSDVKCVVLTPIEV